MIWLINTLAIGAQADCARKDIPTIHACKDPYHTRAVHHRKLTPDSPRYLYAVEGDHLYLNMIDPPEPLFHLELFERPLDFIDTHIHGGIPGALPRVLIHCNQGLSRAPSIALLWMAMRTHELPDISFEAARDEFEKLMPTYAPGAGIATFLTQHWDEP